MTIANWQTAAESGEITFSWNTGNITVMKNSLLEESAAYLKKLLNTATKNREEVAEELREYIQASIDALDGKNAFDKKRIEKYNKLLAIFADRKQTREEKVIEKLAYNKEKPERLTGVIIDSGKYCVMDKICCIRLASRPYGIKDAAGEYNISKVFGNIADFSAEIELPDAATMRKDIKLAKNNCVEFGRYHINRIGKKVTVYYDCGYNKPLVNAEYLLTFLDALPDCKAYYNPERGMMSFLYFTAGENDGIICPVKKEEEFEKEPETATEEHERVQETREEEPRPETTTTEENATADTENAETADIVKQSPAMPYNLSQIKKALAAGYSFVIVKHYVKPELSGQLRKANKVQSNGFYSIVPGEPENAVSVANDGRGYWLDYSAAKDWKFDGDIITRYSRGNAILEISFNLSYSAQQAAQKEPEEPEITEEEKRAVIVSRLSAVAAAVSISDLDGNILSCIIRQFKRGYITEEEAIKLLLFPVSAVNKYALALPEYIEPENAQETEEPETAGNMAAWYNPQQETPAEVIGNIAAIYRETATGDATIDADIMPENSADIDAGNACGRLSPDIEARPSGITAEVAGSLPRDPSRANSPGDAPTAVYVPVPVLRLLQVSAACPARSDSSFCDLSALFCSRCPRPP